jgi:phage shock protein A
MPVATPRAVLLLVLCCSWLPLAATAADPARLKLTALIQEGDLLLEEVAKLEPVGEQLTQEGKALDQAERDLRTASPALESDIRKYNEELNALEQGAAARQARCPKESADNALVESCNAEAARLNTESQRLGGVRDSLDARRVELNRRIEQFNQARREFTGRRQAHERQVGPNKTDVDYWVERAAQFIASPDFKSLYVLSATEPGTCAAGTLGELKTLHHWEALKRAQRCLRAVRDGLPAE